MKLIFRQEVNLEVFYSVHSLFNFRCASKTRWQ